MKFHYRLALVYADSVRRAYSRTLQRRCCLAPRERIDIEVVSFSGRSHFPEQVASICSFLGRVGAPRCFTVVSDGTYTAADIEVLAALHPSIRVVAHDEYRRPGLPEAVLRHARNHPMGRKLATQMSMPVDRLTVYADSDVLFFGGRAELEELASGSDRRPRYLPDCAVAFDSRMLVPGEAKNPVNAGFLILLEPLDFSPGICRLEALADPPEFFSDQTAVHLAMHASGAVPLDDRWVLSLSDQFAFRDRFRPKTTNAQLGPFMRHYVAPVRYRFWVRVGFSAVLR